MSSGPGYCFQPQSTCVWFFITRYAHNVLQKEARCQQTKEHCKKGSNLNEKTMPKDMMKYYNSIIWGFRDWAKVKCKTWINNTYHWVHRLRSMPVRALQQRMAVFIRTDGSFSGSAPSREGDQWPPMAMASSLPLMPTKNWRERQTGTRERYNTQGGG